MAPLSYISAVIPSVVMRKHNPDKAFALEGAGVTAKLELRYWRGEEPARRLKNRVQHATIRRKGH
jgi:hypothetical protein